MTESGRRYRMSRDRMIMKTETARCLLCGPEQAACSQACPFHLEAADMIRSLRFDNESGAAAKMYQNRDRNPCSLCEEQTCMKVCRRRALGTPVQIKSILGSLKKEQEQSGTAEPDLSVEFCGIRCENPFFLSSSIVGSNYEMTARALSMGWAGVAFKTISGFVPKETSPRFARLEKEDNPMVGFKNIEQISDHTLEENLEYLKRLKTDFPEKVIIASIMGRDEQEWTELAELVEKAGADIVECNFSCPHMSGEGLGSDIGTNPELVARYTAAVRKGTGIPVLAKMTPNITNMEIPALAAVQNGADGIAAINTLKSVMNVNLHSFASEPDVCGKSTTGGYSGKAVKPVALRFIHDLKTDRRLAEVPVSGMGGIETWRDACEFLALGCGTVQVTTAVMQYGYRVIDDLTDGLKRYLQKEKMSGLNELIGRALPNMVPAESLDRDSICFPKFIRENCLGCGRCFLSCQDGGHQAIAMKQDKPVLLPEKCVGCQLCTLVCPGEAIVPGTRIKTMEQHG